MSAATAKENILKKIREALANTTPLPFPASEGNQSVYQPASDDLAVDFASHFTSLQGKFVFCQSRQELAEQLAGLREKMGWNKIYCIEDPLRNLLQQSGFSDIDHNELASCDAAITGCEYLVARTGSIVLSSASASGRTVSVYAPVHCCIAFSDQLQYDVRDALAGLKEKFADQWPSLISFATGPSRTADIEKTLVVGVHGPREVYCFLLDEKSPA